MIPSTLLGPLTPSQFLKRYWQKRPLLVRGAFPNFRDPITPNELAGLACESDVASRLVMERGGAMPWQVTPGPQNAARLRKLPASHWTLLVQGMDRLVPGVAALLEPFSFVPDWRVDDVMISFAPRAGTVGPHRDSYDVFLLQGQGRRRWRLDRHASQELRAGFDLRLLKRFSAEEDWILEPGDMLYLPPGLAHYGVALEDCLTYSIGFRAPSEMDLITAMQQRLAQSDEAPNLYTDPDLSLQRFAGEVPQTSVRALRRLLERGLSRLDDQTFSTLVGEFLTEPKGTVAPEPHRRISVTALQSRVKNGAALHRTPGSRLVFLRRGQGIDLFVNGRRFPLTRTLAFAAPLLTGKTRVLAKDLTPRLKRPDFLQLLTSLVNSGAFQLGRSS
jgi:50S ribosomal protein L16 3-hydroxylase